ncbi:hypothetical protein ACFV0L_29395 [Streptosporangium canum]|uniref:hypothetical protein n=1 Tax=Streptosporangium canum TaxID=324952 RepID=UPI0036999994
MKRWTALRRTPLTAREKQGKAKYLVICVSAERLGVALGEQSELIHTLRAHHSFTTP